MAETLPIVVPVRYSGGGLTMQTTSSRLSAEGVFVRGFVTPKEGAVLSLTLTLPGVAQPIQAKGVNAEGIQSITPAQALQLKRAAGAGLQFVDSDDEFRRRLDLCIDNLLNQPAE